MWVIAVLMVLMSATRLTNAFVAEDTASEVSGILDKFQEDKKKLNRGSIADKAVQVICEGIAKYFDQVRTHECVCGGKCVWVNKKI